MDKKKVREALRNLENYEPLSDSSVGIAMRLLNEALAPEPRFYVGQPVLVCSNDTDQPYIPKTLVNFNSEKGDFFCKDDLRRDCGSSWEQCKPDLKAVSLPNWVEHDGESVIIDPPENSILVWETKDGAVCHSIMHRCFQNELARYCIIPLPQFL